MCKVLDKDTIKPEILPHLSVAKHGCFSKRLPGKRYSIHFPQVENWLSIPSYFCFSMILFPQPMSCMPCHRLRCMP